MPKALFEIPKPCVMGILNVSPDSFSAGMGFKSLTQIKDAALRLQEEGADIIDIGAESSRPGAKPISTKDELNRLTPVLQALTPLLKVPISVDTYKPEVMRHVISMGVEVINDIYALQKPGAIEAVADSEVYVCLMHMQGNPQNMQDAPSYKDVIKEVVEFLNQRVKACTSHGLAKNRLIIDPGFGFGKALQHNILLLKHLSQLKSLGLPILAGLSRKSMIGAIINKDVEKRLFGSIAAAQIAHQKGASIIRCHDVQATKDALIFYDAVEGYNEN